MTDAEVEPVPWPEVRQMAQDLADARRELVFWRFVYGPVSADALEQAAAHLAGCDVCGPRPGQPHPCGNECPHEVECETLEQLLEVPLSADQAPA